MVDLTELITRISRAEEAGFSSSRHLTCHECGGEYAPTLQKITGAYCPDCFLEINYGIIPRQKTSFVGSTTPDTSWRRQNTFDDAVKVLESA